MTTAARGWRFTLVGAMGMGVQLGSLALLNRVAPGSYLPASAAALELTLLHNFAWHLRCTWSDRRGGGTRLAQCVRFHLSNGAVSMAGNLIVMRLLVRSAHLPVVASNLIAIACCSAANFWLGNRWAFACEAVPGGANEDAAARLRAPVRAPVRGVAGGVEVCSKGAR
ncbi:MAG: GtrA family protein [Acidobacteriota bacterium]|nr:GtrA family protein [Acidobacteriota bacterium]